MTRSKNLTVELERMGPFDPDAMSVRDARAALHAFYRANGRPRAPRLLTPPENQPKLRKSKQPDYGLTLAPADMSGWDVCTWRTPACTAACVLATGGRSGFSNIRAARSLKTRALAEHPQAFITALAHEIDAAVRKARAAGFSGIDLRPNIASDLRWERIAPTAVNRDGVRVYDYTKAPASQRDVSGVYARLTFSVSERDRSVAEALEWLRSGGNVAVVFERPTRSAWDGLLPETWQGFAVIDGDLTDARADDPDGTVVGLRAKGAAIGTAGAADGFVKEGAAS